MKPYLRPITASQSSPPRDTKGVKTLSDLIFVIFLLFHFYTNYRYFVRSIPRKTTWTMERQKKYLICN